MKTLELMPETVSEESSGNRTFTASAKLSKAEYNTLKTKAAYSGKRVGDWVREVLLRELSGQEVPDIVLAELLGIRMILLNLLGAIVRGEKVSLEQLQNLVGQIDAQKMNRALEKIRAMRLPRNGGR